jgi:hypothetical protein
MILWHSLQNKLEFQKIIVHKAFHKIAGIKTFRNLTETIGSVRLKLSGN